MRTIFFILMGFFPLLVSAQSVEIRPTTYALNDIGEEYRVETKSTIGDSTVTKTYKAQVLGDLSKIGQFINDSLTIQDVESLRVPGTFAMDLRVGMFVLHSKGSISNVYSGANTIIRIEHERSASVFYQYEWGECYMDDPNKFLPEMTVRIVYRYGEFAIQAVDCTGDVKLVLGTSEEALLLWEIYSPLWKR